MASARARLRRRGWWARRLQQRSWVLPAAGAPLSLAHAAGPDQLMSLLRSREPASFRALRGRPGSDGVRSVDNRAAEPGTGRRPRTSR
jgi:hypothetical protein